MEHSNRKIAKNSLTLYIRMFFVLGLGLVSSRYILETLGIEDYGIYNVVAGVVTLFNFISVSMNSASSRFLTTSIGKKNEKEIKETFKAACTVHIIIAVVLALVGETIGLWIVLNKLVIPENQHISTLIVYQLAIAISIISVVQTPFSATLIAHEKMSIYAGIEILNASLKFLAIIILFIIPTDRLVVYMLNLLLVSVIIFITYWYACRKKFEYLHFGLVTNKKLLMPMLSFSGWDLYGNMSVAARSQGVNILLNIFFGPLLNAASGLAGQIQSAVGAISSNIVIASKPQIIKSYAIGDTERCVNLLVIISKLTTALLLIICVPIVTNIEYILGLWLKDVPEYTASFAIWCIMFALIANLSTVIMTAIHASGKIKRSSLWNGSLYLLVIPISYICFKFHGNPSIPFIINTIAVAIGLTLNIYYLSKYIYIFKPIQYFKTAIIPIIIMAIVSFGLALLLASLSLDPLLKLIGTTIENTFMIAIFSYYIFLSGTQRKSVLQLVKKYGK